MAKLYERDIVVARMARSGKTHKEIGRELGITPDQVRHSLRKAEVSVRKIRGEALPADYDIRERWKVLLPRMLASFHKELRSMGLRPGKRFDHDLPAA
jgi:predicted transcriptional regulator